MLGGGPQGLGGGGGGAESLVPGGMGRLAACGTVLKGLAAVETVRRPEWPAPFHKEAGLTLSKAPKAGPAEPWQLQGPGWNPVLPGPHPAGPRAQGHRGP